MRPKVTFSTSPRVINCLDWIMDTLDLDDRSQLVHLIVKVGSAQLAASLLTSPPAVVAQLMPRLMASLNEDDQSNEERANAA